MLSKIIGEPVPICKYMLMDAHQYRIHDNIVWVKIRLIKIWMRDKFWKNVVKMQTNEVLLESLLVFIEVLRVFIFCHWRREARGTYILK